MTTAAPRPAPQTLEWRCLDFRRFSKETLQGFAKLHHPRTGITIHDCPVHQKAGRRWINFPARRYTPAPGQPDEWTPVVEIKSKEARETFQREALAALNQFLASPDYRKPQ